MAKKFSFLNQIIIMLKLKVYWHLEYILYELYVKYKVTLFVNWFVWDTGSPDTEELMEMHILPQQAQL